MTSHGSGQGTRPAPRVLIVLVTALPLALAAAGAGGQQADPAAPIHVGQSVEANLVASDRVLEDGSYHDDYVFHASVGDRLIITLRSEHFDAFLHLGWWDGDDFETLHTDDDGAGGTDARIWWTARAPGAYVIRANSLEAGETGAYVLSLQEMPPPVPVNEDEAPPLRPGDVHHGTLWSDDPFLDDGTHYHLFRLDATARERFVITLRSDDFDAYMDMGWADRGEFVILASDDDGAGGTDAMLEWAAPGTGTYLVRVNTFEAAATGRYTLAIESGAP